MGYQESLMYIKPQKMFTDMLDAYQQAEKKGYYEYAGAMPLSVIILKEELFGYPAGTKLLWVCGDRGWHTEVGIFNQRLSKKLIRPYRITFIPAEDWFPPFGYNNILKGIDLESSESTENAYMIRYTIENYIENLNKDREHKHR